MILGITGAIGAGKDTVVEYLVQKYNFVAGRGSDLLAKEVSRRGLPLIRENFHNVANEMRESQGDAFLVDLLAKEVSGKGKNIVIGFFRTTGEVKRFRELFSSSKLIAVDASVEIRYERISGRKKEKDRVSFEEFKRQDLLEAESNSPSRQNIRACVKSADIVISNELGEDVLYKKIDDLLISLND